MKKIMLATAIVLLSAIAFTGNAQKKSDVAKEKEVPLQKITTYTGEVQEWVNNDDFLLNGFYLQTIDTRYLVTFLPNMGSTLRANIKTENTISVNGIEQTTRNGVKVIQLESLIAANGVKVNVTPPDNSEKPSVLEYKKGSGTITDLQQDNQGKVIGYIVDNSTILCLPPNVIQQLSTMNLRGTTVSYNGSLQVLNHGEFPVNDYSVIHCKTITINGKEY